MTRRQKSEEAMPEHPHNSQMIERAPAFVNPEWHRPRASGTPEARHAPSARDRNILINAANFAM